MIPTNLKRSLRVALLAALVALAFAGSADAGGLSQPICEEAASLGVNLC